MRAFVGHGIGTEMHEEPQVTNYRTGSQGRRIEPGLCLAIEPMFTLGSHEVSVRDDGWTVVTADGSPRRALGAHDRGDRRPAHPDHDRETMWLRRHRRRLGGRGVGHLAERFQSPFCPNLWYTSRSCAGPVRTLSALSDGAAAQLVEPPIHH